MTATVNASGQSAAAAQASVSAAAIFDVGTDYVVRGGLALIHPGETIIPAGMQRAVGSGPFTGAGVGGRGGGAGDVHLNINGAIDSRSIQRFFHDNAGANLKSISRAIRNGAHLNLRNARA